MTKDLLKVEDVVKKTGLSEAHIRQLLREKKIVGTKCGKEWRVTLDNLNKYLGIEYDSKLVEKEIYIKELEAKVKGFEMQINTFKNLVYTLGNIVGM